MSDTDRLRDLLEQAAPDATEVSATERASAVADRGRAARRRDRGLVAAVVAAVAVVAVAVPMARGGHDDPEPVGPTPRAADCPAVPFDVTTLTDATIPDDLDIASARLCPGVANAGGLPNQALTGEGAGAFLEDLRAAQPIDPGAFCTDIGYVPSLLQLQAPDGHLVRVTLTRSCSESVTVGDRRVRMSDAFAVFTGNLERQESGTPDLACPRASRIDQDSDLWNTSFDPSTATRGIVCDRPDEYGKRAHEVVEGALDDDELALVRSDLSTTPTYLYDAIGFDCSGPLERRWILLANDAGDRAGWRFAVCNDPADVESVAGDWSLGDQALAAIHNALLRATIVR